MKNDIEFLRDILENIHDGVCYVDKDLKIGYWNATAETFTGYPAAQVTGKFCYDNIIMHVDTAGKSYCNTENCPIMHAINSGKTIETDVFIKHRQGYRIPVIARVAPIKDRVTGVIKGAVEVFHDNAAKLTAFTKVESLKEMAYIDPLTDVGTRRFIEKRIADRLEEMNKYAWAPGMGIMMIDLDNFKKINDTHGHDAGDAVLKLVSKTLINNIGENDYIGRWGGEEFIVLKSGGDNKELLRMAEKLRAMIEASGVELAGKELAVTASFGVTMADKTDTLDSLIKRADVLMYQSKEEGKNTVSIG